MAPKILRDVVDGVQRFLTALAVVLPATLKVDLGGLLASSATGLPCSAGRTAPRP